MPLSQAQQRIARFLIGFGRQRGLSPARALELAAAAYAESGLSPTATNRSSGAAGLFQLLSGGYRSRAKQLGGLYDPRANTLAILPDYLRYWRQHPNAAPGEAGREVERSGMGAGFYSSPLRLLKGVGGAVADQGPQPMPVPPQVAAAPAPDLRATIAQQLASGKPIDWVSLAAQTIRARQQPTARQPLAAAASRQPPTGTPPTGGYPQMVQRGGAVSGEPGLASAPQADVSHVDPRILALLSEYARMVGKPIEIISGYRSPGYSAKVGGFANDPHTRGVAVDAYIAGTPIGSYPGAYKWLSRHGLESGAQPGFYRGRPDPMHVQIPGSGVNKTIRYRRRG